MLFTWAEINTQYILEQRKAPIGQLLEQRKDAIGSLHRENSPDRSARMTRKFVKRSKFLNVYMSYSQLSYDQNFVTHHVIIDY